MAPSLDLLLEAIVVTSKVLPAVGAVLLLLPPLKAPLPPPPTIMLPALTKLSHFDDSISFSDGISSISVVIADDHWLGAAVDDVVRATT